MLIPGALGACAEALGVSAELDIGSALLAVAEEDAVAVVEGDVVAVEVFFGSGAIAELDALLFASDEQAPR